MCPGAARKGLGQGEPLEEMHPDLMKNTGPPPATGEGGVGSGDSPCEGTEA